MIGVTTLLSTVNAFPDVKHLKSLQIQENREYLPPNFDAKPNNINPVIYSTSSTVESTTGYDYPKPRILFPPPSENSINIETTKYTPPKKTYAPAASNIDTTFVKSSTSTTTPKPLKRDYLPPQKSQKINQFNNVARTGAESRVVSTTTRPLTKDYLPPFSGSENRVNINVIPSPSPRPLTKDYLPPIRINNRPRPVTSTASTTTTTTSFSSTPNYAPAANSPIPSVVPSTGPYYTKFDEKNGYDYSKPQIGFDLPQNSIPVLFSSTTEETNYSSAPTNNVPVYSSTTTSTTTSEREPPAPEVIYTPSHTLDENGYKYKLPNIPFNF